MCTTTTPEMTARPTLLLENDRVRVTRWSFDFKGGRTGWHRHEYDYVVVPEFDGTLEIDLPDDGHMTAELTTGVPYYRPLGTEHDVVSGNDFPCSFVEIELLDRKG